MSIISNIEIARKFYEQRHAKIAENIANADIPKKRARDVSMDFSKLVGKGTSLNMRVTNANHIGFGSRDIVTRTVFRKGEKNINGNDIDLKVEAEHLTSNAGDSNTAADIYKEIWKLIKLALGN